VLVVIIVIVFALSGLALRDAEQGLSQGTASLLRLASFSIEVEARGEPQGGELLPGGES
jgi:hypothetical protein